MPYTLEKDSLFRKGLTKDSKYHIWMGGVKLPGTVVVKATIPKSIIPIPPANFTIDYELQEMSMVFDEALSIERQKLIERWYQAAEASLVERIIGPYRDKGKRQW